MATAVAFAGIAAILLLAATSAMAVRDVLALLALATGTIVAVALISTLALRQLRGRPLGWHVAALSCATTLAVILGAWVGARMMFLSSHDLAALQVLLVAGGTAGCVAGLLFGERLAERGGDLVEATRRLGELDDPPDLAARPLATELDHVGAELRRTSHRLRDTRQRERQLESSRSALIAWVSADLRVPLDEIEQVVDHLAATRELGPEEIARLRRSTNRLAVLLDDLVELSAPAERGNGSAQAGSPDPEA